MLQRCKLLRKLSSMASMAQCDQEIVDIFTTCVIRRCETGRTVTKGRFELDNRWVVPYNPYLCHKYNAHIHVEVCATIKSVKYIYKYIYKGHDRAQVQITAGVSLLLSLAML